MSMTRVLLLALVVELLVAIPTAVAAQPVTSHAAKSYCGSPRVVGGQPTAVVIVIDGSSSSEPESGSAYPIRVSKPAKAIPVVRSYCPIARSGAQTRWPAGLRYGLRTWAKQGNPAQKQSGTSACVANSGKLDTSRCLLASLADAGAIVLPYSYTGAKVRKTKRGAVFHFSGYVGDDTEQAPATSVARLDTMIDSVIRAWPKTSVYVVGHSLGGMIAEGWWRQAQQDRSRPTHVRHVFTLDSPINGVTNCMFAGPVVGVPAAKEFCQRRTNRNALDQLRIRLDKDRSFTAVATPRDPAYALAGGNIRNQAVYSCPDFGNDPHSKCIAAPPSFISSSAVCDPTQTRNTGRRPSPGDGVSPGRCPDHSDGSPAGLSSLISSSSSSRARPARGSRSG